MFKIIGYIIVFIICSIVIGELFSISNKLDKLIKIQTITAEKITGRKIETEENTDQQNTHFYWTKRGAGKRLQSKRFSPPPFWLL